MKGQTLSHYRVIEVVGQGASGLIYKAEDLALGRVVALKCLPSDMRTGGASGARFQHEARTASAINHPNICTIHEIAEHNGVEFIVMEWLDGKTLADLIDRRPLKLEHLLEYGIQIADGLQSAHATGVVHRDLKPTNILITTQGQVKILDFGISLLMPPPTPNDAHGKAPVGTIPYMSPEQVQCEDIDPRSDLFSLGTVLYEMATGRRPFIAGTMPEIMQLILEQSPAPPRSLNPDLPADFDRIVLKAMEKNRKLRFQTASDLRVDLQRLKRDFDSRLLGSALTASTVSRSKVNRRPTRSWVKVSSAGLAIAASIILVLGAITPETPAIPLAPPSPAAPGSDIVLALPELTPPELTPPEAQPVQVKKPAPPSAALKGRVVSTVVGLSAPSIPPAPAPVEVEDAIGQELRIARNKAAAGLHEQALQTVRDLLVRHAGAREALEAYFLMASIQEAQAKREDAMATYLEIADRFKSDGRSAEALYRFADLTLKSKRSQKEAEARKVLAQLADAYPASPFAPRALMMKAGVEERQRLQERDDVLATSVPSALVTYRRLSADYPEAPGAEIALQKIAEMHEDADRFDLAAVAWVDLATRHPTSSSDSWFRAAELYRRRLKNMEAARNAYARVPATSRHFKDAQSRLK